MRDAAASSNGRDAVADSTAEADGPPDGVEAGSGRVVAIWGPTGAPGRTTIAVTLATELAALGIPTVLVDADTYGGSVAQALSFLDEAPGIAAATRAADQGTLDLPTLARLAPVATAGLRVLTGIPKAERWPEVRPAALERVLTVESVAGPGRRRRLRLQPRGRRGAQLRHAWRPAATARRSRPSPWPTRSSSWAGATRWGCSGWFAGCRSWGRSRRLAPTVCVNRVRSGAVGSNPEQRVSEALARFAGVTDVLFVPDDPAALDTALLEGRALVECAPGSPVRPAVRSIAEKVAGAPVGRGRRRRRGLRVSR